VKIRNTLLLGAASALCLLLTACASDPAKLPPFAADALPPPNLHADAGKASIATVRVLVQFSNSNANQTATTQSFDDDTFVTTLQVHAQVPMHYIAAVSADTHVYGLELYPTQDPAAAVQRLRALPSVARVELDTSKAKAH
jgi:hypothetical protein